jgi:hypothetical protein
MIHFRPSGNAPEMRCYVEAGSESEAKSLLAQGLELIRVFPKRQCQLARASDVPCESGGAVGFEDDEPLVSEIEMGRRIDEDR